MQEIIDRSPMARFDRAHLARFGESALEFEVVYYVTDPDYNKYMDVQQQINLELIERLQSRRRRIRLSDPDDPPRDARRQYLMAAKSRGRLIVVSNRLPTDGGAAGRRSAEAQAAAAAGWYPPWRRSCGRAAACGSAGPASAAATRASGSSSWRPAGSRATSSVPVFLTSEQRDGFYHGFANEIIWPLFHDLQSLCNFDPAYWQAYQDVNERYAKAVAATAGRSDLVWIHDYQLMGVGESSRRLGVTGPLAFFLHIPFPSPDIFGKLPWREAVLRSLLAYDLLGFQTPRDRHNFVDCVRQFLPGIRVSGRRQKVVRLRDGKHEVRASRFPSASTTTTSTGGRRRRTWWKVRRACGSYCRTAN